MDSLPTFIFPPETEKKMLRILPPKMKQYEKDAKIRIIFGPMFSGKTTELIRLFNRERHSSKAKPLFIKYVGDIRYDQQNLVVSHDKASVEAEMISGKQLFFKREEILKGGYTSVFIDEGQFFDGIVDFSRDLQLAGIDVTIAALDGNFQGANFGNLYQLIPYALEVQKLTSRCRSCDSQDALFTIFKTQTLEDDTGPLDLSDRVGADEYMAVCFKCRQKVLEENSRLKQSVQNVKDVCPEESY